MIQPTIGIPRRLIIGLCSLLMLAGCDQLSSIHSDSNTENLIASNFSLTKPPLLSNRAIDSSLLRVRVTINGETYGLTRNGDSWNGSFPVPQFENIVVRVIWLQDNLELASHTTDSIAVTQDLVIDINPDMYDPTPYDLDGDGLHNLLELRGNTNPNDSLSPGIINLVSTQIAEQNFNLADLDGDQTIDINDNCPSIFNFDQLDSDGDNIGDICDASNGPAQNPGLPTVGSDRQVRLSSNARINSVTSLPTAGGSNIELSVSLSESWGEFTTRDIIAQLVSEDGRTYVGTLSTTNNVSLDPSTQREYNVNFSVFGPSQSYYLLVSERVPGRDENVIIATDVANESIFNPSRFFVDVGTIGLVTPIQVEESTNEQGFTKLEFIFAVQELSGSPVSAKIFLNISSDNDRQYPRVSNSSNWNAQRGTTQFLANERVQFRIPLESDIDGEALRSGNYTVMVNAWRFNQIDPEMFGVFEILDLDLENQYGDGILFLLP